MAKIKNTNTNKKITLESLAVTMKNGFDETAKNMKTQVENLAVMVKNGFDEAAKDTKEQFGKVNERLDGIDKRLDVIENINIAGQYRRIEVLEDKMILVKTTLEKLIGKELR